MTSNLQNRIISNTAIIYNLPYIFSKIDITSDNILNYVKKYEEQWCKSDYKPDSKSKLELYNFIVNIQPLLNIILDPQNNTIENIKFLVTIKEQLLQNTYSTIHNNELYDTLFYKLKKFIKNYSKLELTEILHTTNICNKESIKNNQEVLFNTLCKYIDTKTAFTHEYQSIEVKSKLLNIFNKYNKEIKAYKCSDKNYTIAIAIELHNYDNIQPANIINNICKDYGEDISACLLIILPNILNTNNYDIYKILRYIKNYLFDNNIKLDDLSINIITEKVYDSYINKVENIDKVLNELINPYISTKHKMN